MIRRVLFYKTLGLILISTSFINSLSASSCAKCTKIEAQREEEQRSPNYVKPGYYDPHAHTTSEIKTEDLKNQTTDDRNEETTDDLSEKKVDLKELSSVWQKSAQWLAALESVHLNPSSDEMKDKQVDPAIKNENPSSKISQADKPNSLPSSPLHQSTLADLLNIRNLMDVFENSFTILVPSDAAIKAFPSGALKDILLPENRELLFSYITNHIIPHQILKRDFNKTFKTMGGRVVEIESTENGLTVNENAKILKSFPLGNEGILYVIDKVLIPIHD